MSTDKAGVMYTSTSTHGPPRIGRRNLCEDNAALRLQDLGVMPRV